MAIVEQVVEDNVLDFLEELDPFLKAYHTGSLCFKVGKSFFEFGLEEMLDLGVDHFFQRTVIDRFQITFP